MKDRSTLRAPSASRLLFGLFVLGVAAMPILAQAAAPVEKSLSSGARALLWPRAGSGTVLITVAVPAGSQDEPVEMAGLSHYLEHLLFDGFDDLDERGVTEAFEMRSAYVNAFTREQNTVFFALAPAEEAVASAGLLIGMLNRSNIVPATYEKERKVILEELAKDQTSVENLKEESLRSALWRGTPLEHPVGGFEHTVAATDRETVEAYWKDRYRPGSWRILITGDLPLDGLEAVYREFEGLPATQPLPARTDPLKWEGWGGWRAVPTPKVEGGGSGMPGGMGGGMPSMGGMPGRGAATEGGTLSFVVAPKDGWNRTELEVLARWMSEAGGPLARILVPEHAESVSASLDPQDPRDLVVIRVKARADADPSVVLNRLMGGLRLAAHGPSDDDVLRVSRAWQAERVLTGQRLHYAAVFYGDALATERGPLREAVDPSEVEAAAVRTAAASLFEDANRRSRAAWVGDGGPQVWTTLPNEVEEPASEDVGEVASGPFGSRVSVLANGLTVGVLPEVGGQVFGIHLLVADRSAREPEESPGIADLVHRLLPAGTALSGSSELGRRLARAGIEIKAADSPMIPFDDRYHVSDFSYVRLEGPAASFEEALALLAEMIREPAWDEAGLEKAMSDHRASRRAGGRADALAAQSLYGSLLGEDSPMTRPVSGPVDGEIPDPDAVCDFWGRWPQGYFAPDGVILTVASPVPEGETLEIIEDLFGAGKEASPRTMPVPPVRAVGGTVTIGDGQSPQTTMLWGRRFTVPETDRAALLVAVNALSDQMVARIREEEGLAYRLGAGLRVLPGGDWVLAARVGTRPDNQERVTELMGEITSDLATTPLEPEMLGRYAARDRRSTMLRSLSAASRAYRLGRALFEGEASTLLVKSTDRRDVTPAQVQKAAARYLELEDMVLVVSR